MDTTFPSQQTLALLMRVEELVAELKINSLNLTIINAKLKIKDPANQAMSKQFGELLDNVNETYNEADLIVKLARGKKVKERSVDFSKLQIDDNLCKIQKTAEEIIENIIKLKKTENINKKI